MKEKIYNLLHQYLLSENIKEYSIDDLKTQITLSPPKLRNHGDLSTNFALKFSKELECKPMELGDKVIDFFNKNSQNLFSEIMIKKPGFINFYFNINFLANDVLSKIQDDKKINLKLQNKSINVEFLSANPTGLLHIGHARNVITGDIIVKMFEALGSKVTREYYINDAGSQINKLGESVYYYYLLLNNKKPEIKEEELGYKGQEIIDYANKIKDDNRFLKLSKEEAINKLSLMSKDYFLDVIKETSLKLNVKPFDIFTSEQELYDKKSIEEVIKKLKKTSSLYEKDGATFIKTSDFTDVKDRVIIKSDNSFTYMMADVANHVNKYEKKYDLIMNIWGSDHHGYEERIRSSCIILGYPDKLKVAYISMVKVKKNGQDLKMSKRQGTSLTIEDVLGYLTPDEIRYAMIEKSKEQNLTIDIDKIKEKGSNNNFWYVQYANARINQLLTKFNSKYKFEKVTKFTQLTNAERDIILQMINFENVLLKASRLSEPSILWNFLRELAGFFHSYYNSFIIISDDFKHTIEKVNLLVKLKKMFEQIFFILGISPINKM